MIGRKTLIQTLVAGGMGFVAAWSLYSTVIEEAYQDTGLKETMVFARAIDGDGHTAGWMDTTFVIAHRGRLYARNSYPSHWHKWTLAEGAGSVIHDSFGHANGILGAGAEWRTDSTGTSVYFDGEDDRILLPNDFTYGNEAGDSLHVSARFNVKSFGNGDGRIFSKASGNAEDDHLVMMSIFREGDEDGCLRARLKTDEGGTITVKSAPGLIELNKDYRAEMSYDGIAVRLWLNGVLVASARKTGRIVLDPTIPGAIGNQPDGTKGLNAEISEVVTW